MVYHSTQPSLDTALCVSPPNLGLHLVSLIVGNLEKGRTMVAFVIVVSVLAAMSAVPLVMEA